LQLLLTERVRMKKRLLESWVIRWLRYVNTWREHRRIIKELNALDDKTLRDIGINRCDIDTLIWLEHDLERRGKNGK
jgi:uncharacterized protein YjiS (DUF1127 family)